MLQQSLFETEQDLTPQQYYQGGSPASHIALRASVWALVTSVIYGTSSPELFARLNHNGLWEKTLRGCYQVRLDDILDEFSGTWPGWGIVWDGAAIRLPGLEPCIDETGYLLLPTPVASLDKGFSIGTARALQQGVKHRKSGVKIGSDLNWHPELSRYYTEGTRNVLNPYLLERMMGFPPR